MDSGIYIFRMVFLLLLLVIFHYGIVYGRSLSLFLGAAEGICARLWFQLSELVKHSVPRVLALSQQVRSHALGEAFTKDLPDEAHLEWVRLCDSPRHQDEVAIRHSAVLLYQRRWMQTVQVTTSCVTLNSTASKSMSSYLRLIDPRLRTIIPFHEITNIGRTEYLLRSTLLRMSSGRKAVSDFVSGEISGQSQRPRLFKRKQSESNRSKSGMARVNQALNDIPAIMVSESYSAAGSSSGSSPEQESSLFLSDFAGTMEGCPMSSWASPIAPAVDLDDGMLHCSFTEALGFPKKAGCDQLLDLQETADSNALVSEDISELTAALSMDSAKDFEDPTPVNTTLKFVQSAVNKELSDNSETHRLGTLEQDMEERRSFLEYSDSPHQALMHSPPDLQSAEVVDLEYSCVASPGASRIDDTDTIPFATSELILDEVTQAADTTQILLQESSDSSHVSEIEGIVEGTPYLESVHGVIISTIEDQPQDAALSLCLPLEAYTSTLSDSTASDSGMKKRPKYESVPLQDLQATNCCAQASDLVADSTWLQMPSSVFSNSAEVDEVSYYQGFDNDDRLVPAVYESSSVEGILVPRPTYCEQVLRADAVESILGRSEAESRMTEVPDSVFPSIAPNDFPSERGLQHFPNTVTGDAQLGLSRPSEEERSKGSDEGISDTECMMDIDLQLGLLDDAEASEWSSRVVVASPLGSMYHSFDPYPDRQAVAADLRQEESAEIHAPIVSKSLAHVDTPANTTSVCIPRPQPEPAGGSLSVNSLTFVNPRKRKAYILEFEEDSNSDLQENLSSGNSSPPGHPQDISYGKPGIRVEDHKRHRQGSVNHGADFEESYTEYLAECLCEFQQSEVLRKVIYVELLGATSRFVHHRPIVADSNPELCDQFMQFYSLPGELNRSGMICLLLCFKAALQNAYSGDVDQFPDALFMCYKDVKNMLAVEEGQYHLQPPEPHLRQFGMEVPEALSEIYQDCASTMRDQGWILPEQYVIFLEAVWLQDQENSPPDPVSPFPMEWILSDGKVDRRTLWVEVCRFHQELLESYANGNPRSFMRRFLVWALVPLTVESFDLDALNQPPKPLARTGAL